MNSTKWDNNVKSDEELLKLNDKILALRNLPEEELVRQVADIFGDCTREEAERLILLTMQPIKDSPEVQQLRRAYATKMLEGFQDKSSSN